MKKETLYEAMGDIHEDYIRQAHQTPPKFQPAWRRWAALAACLCLVVAAALAVPKFFPHFGPEQTKDDDYANTIAYAGWTDDPAFFNGALNSQQMQDAENFHLPIYKLDTLGDLEQFQASYESLLDFRQGYDSVLSLEAALSKTQWDREIFYREHSLLVIYIPASSGSLRFGIQKVEAADASLCIYAEQKNDPEICTDDMAGWFLLVAITDEKASNFTSFDAILAASQSQ